MICDFCGWSLDYEFRRIVAVPSPTDPSELVATMWACTSCGKFYNLPRATDLIKSVEAGQEIDGQIYLSIDV